MNSILSLVKQSMYIILLIACAATATCENRPWAEDYGKDCKEYRLVILGTQAGSGGWNEIEPMTYTKIIESGKMLELHGILGKTGDTLSASRDFIFTVCNRNGHGTSCIDFE